MAAHAADRLSPLDTTFLHVETLASPMHVCMVCRFEGAPLRRPDGAIDRERLFRQTQSRLARAPRFRQRVMWMPLGRGRPIWVDDPHFNIAYHVRFTGLPRPGGAPELKLLAGRILSQMLDRTRPLWEMYWVDGLENDEIGLVWKTHHCMVDGVSGVEVATVFFDFDPKAPPAPAPEPWKPQAQPKPARLFGEVLAEGAAQSREWLKGARAAIRNPEPLAKRIRSEFGGIGAWLGRGLAPRTCFNVPIGPHRRVDWVSFPLDEVKRIKNRLGGTVNDVALAVVAGALRRFLEHRGDPVEGLDLHVGIPVSVRRQGEKGTLGNRVSAMMTLLPLGEVDPAERYRKICASMEAEKRSAAADVAETLTNLPGAPPAALLHQIARLQSVQRVLNLVVTNVPGPQKPLYMCGARLLEIAPYLPLGPNVALGVAVLSYHGQLGIGLIGDYDVLHDIDALAACFGPAMAELSEAADASGSPLPPSKREPKRVARAKPSSRAKKRTAASSRPRRAAR